MKTVTIEFLSIKTFRSIFDRRNILKTKQNFIYTKFLGCNREESLQVREINLTVKNCQDLLKIEEKITPCSLRAVQRKNEYPCKRAF